MNPYSLVFANSFKSFLILALGSEYAWNAAVEFGDSNTWLLTLAAVLGSSLAMTVNYAFGYYTSTLRAQWFYFSEETYQRIAVSFRRYFVFLLLIPPLPFLPFVSLLSVVSGIFRVPPKIALPVIVIGRIACYGFYLLQMHKV
jgi:membrane protein YqaA with SNARE-associated domain